MENPRRFNAGPDPSPSSDSLDREKDGGETRTQEEEMQSVTLQLLDSDTCEDLGAIVKTGLKSYLPTAKGGGLFFVEENSKSFYTIDDGAHKRLSTPTPDCLWSAYTSKCRAYGQVEGLDDDFVERLKLASSSSRLAGATPVLCSPLINSRNDSVFAVLVVVVSEQLNKKYTAKLTWLERQIAACYNHIQRTFQSSHGAGERVSQQLMRLCGDLYEADAAQLQLKVIKYLEDQTQAECGFLLLVVPETQELFCQVIGKNILEDEVRFPGESSGFVVALETKQPIHLEHIPAVNRKGIEELIERPVQSLVCVPVTSRSDNNLIALACLVNKHNANRFTERDISCIHQCFRYTSTVLTSTLAFQNERKLKDQTQAMLQVARHLFTNLGDLTKLLREIMQQARNLTHAERCSVFLIDEETDELVAKVFDGMTDKDNEVGHVDEEIRLPITQGIAGHVATSGELLNIKDAYSHPLFYRGIDDSTGFRTRNILCFPIKDEKGRILGVAQLCNKKMGPSFTTFDQDLATAFGIYCCISISHCLMYKKLEESQRRKSLANELMIYHMQVNATDVESLSKVDIPHPRMLDADFVDFTYAPRTMPEQNTQLGCLSMFEDLGFISRWRIRRETLAKFLLMVKRGYRNPPYHNWMHAYTVAQFCYQLVKNLKLDKYLEEVELFALFVSCLCHDIDHRGTNNSFQSISKSVLAALYSSEGSVLERHHFAQTMCILNTEGCNIFENLNSTDYQQILDMMRDIILATDLAHHFKIIKTLQAMADNGYSRSSVKDRKFLLCLLMTSCDLSDQTKPWSNTKDVAAMIYKEFFSQGDMEKAAGYKPLEMYDRDKAQIPELQIGFLEHVATPVFRLLGQMFPAVQVLATAVDANKQHWEKISNLIKLKRGGSCTTMTFNEVLAIENEDEYIENDDNVTMNHVHLNGQQ